MKFKRSNFTGETIDLRNGWHSGSTFEDCDFYGCTIIADDLSSFKMCRFDGKCEFKLKNDLPA